MSNQNRHIKTVLTGTACVGEAKKEYCRRYSVTYHHTLGNLYQENKKKMSTLLYAFVPVHRNCLYELTSPRKREITRVLLLFYVPSISTMADTNCWGGGGVKDIWKTALLNALLFIIIRPLALYCTGLKIGIVFIRLSDYQPPTEKSKYVDGGGCLDGLLPFVLDPFCYYWVNLMWVSPIPNILKSAGRKRSRKGFRNQSKHLFKLAALW